MILVDICTECSDNSRDAPEDECAQTCHFFRVCMAGVLEAVRNVAVQVLQVLG